MSYLNYDGLAYFKSKLTNWVDQNYLSKTNTGNLTVAGHVTFTNPITGDLDGKAKKDWLGQKIDETYIKSIATNDNAGTIVYTKGNGSTNHILIDLLQGATPIANGRAGLVPAPTVSEMNYFLRGDGNWAIPTDVYVNQSLLTGETEAQNKSFPILLSGTSSTPTSKTNATVAYPSRVGINPRTNSLMASHFISKHPSYTRTSTVTSKVQYTLNFTDNDEGVGNILGEVVGYIDPASDGGEHELGLRVFGNPNVQGVEEDYVYLGVGLSKTNIAYGHAPSTPLPSAHNEPTDIITRDWLARNGSETGLVHTSMNETIDGTKTFVKKIVANDGMNATGNIATDTLTVRQDANVKGSLDVDTNLNVDGTSNLHGKVTAGNGLEVTGNTKTTTLTVTSGATVGTTLGVGGKATISGGLAVTSGTTTDTLNVTNGATVSGGATVATGNLTVTSGGVTVSNGTGTFKNLNVTSNGTFGGTITANAANIGSGGLTVAGDTNLQNTTVKNLYVTSKIYDSNNNEYVQKVINDNRQTVINNLIKENGGLAQDSNHHIYVKVDNSTIANTSGTLGVNTSGLAANLSGDLIAPNGGLQSISNKLAVKTGDGIQVSNGYVTTRLTANKGLGYNGTTANAKSIGVVLKDNGGLKCDSTGLYVDFSSNEPDNDEIINNVRGALGIQIPLKHSITLYVNQNDTNAVTDEWRKASGAVDESVGKYSVTTDATLYGKTVTCKPFKTIQSAIACATQGYSLGAFNIYIKVVAGNNSTPYEGPITLPAFNHTSGGIRIMPEGETDPIIVNTEAVGGVFLCTGNGWYLERLDIRNTVTYPDDSNAHYPTCVTASGAGHVHLLGCKVTCTCPNETAPNNKIYPRMFSATTNGTIAFELLTNVVPSITAHMNGNPHLSVLFAERQGYISFNATNSGDATSDWHKIACSGECEIFARAAKQSLITTIGGASFDLEFSGSMTGKRCDIDTASAVSFSAVCPGDTVGTVDHDTYCWVKPSAHDMDSTVAQSQP